MNIIQTFMKTYKCDFITKIGEKGDHHFRIQKSSLGYFEENACHYW